MGVKTPPEVTPAPDQVPPAGDAVKVMELAPSQIDWSEPAATTSGDIEIAGVVEDVTAGLLAITLMRYPVPFEVPAGMVTETGLVVPEPITVGDVKLPDALLS